MKKLLGYAVFLLLLALVWMWYLKTGDQTKAMLVEIEAVLQAGDPEGISGKLKAELHGYEGQKVFMGLLLAFLSAGLLGMAFVLDILPLLAHKATHAIYDSAEMIERDIMHDARSLLAQGEYEAAVEAFREAAEADPENRFPWVEIAKIQKEYLHAPVSAITTLREVLETREWPADDAAFFLYRLVDLYDESMGDRGTAVEILNQVVENFPETRHSANAMHKLREWEQQTAAEAAAELENQARQAGASEDADRADEPS